MVIWYSQLQGDFHHRNSGGGIVEVEGVHSGWKQNGDNDNNMLLPGQYLNTVNNQCYGYHQWVYLAFNYPNNNNNCQRQGQGHGKNVTSLFQVIVSFSKNEDQDTISCTCIILDICFTVSVRNNTDMLGKIRDSIDD